MIRVLKPGLDTSIQDYPGRLGYLAVGVPPSGPMDSLSFRLGNLLVGNGEHAAGLEMAFLGPRLAFLRDFVIAVTGAANEPRVNGVPIPMWTAVRVQSGDLLEFRTASAGARSYLAIAGGLDVPQVLGSRSTYAAAQLGGYQGRSLHKDDVLSVCEPSAELAQLTGRTLRPEALPQLSNDWEIDVMLGPHDDWLSEADLQQLLQEPWTVSSRSNRVGYRLEGPAFQFAEKAHVKDAAHGAHPSNIIDYGYPKGAISLCGQTPIILLADGPSLGGYIAPLTVISSDLWKVGQGRPGDRFRFRRVDSAQALESQRALERRIRDAPAW